MKKRIFSAALVLTILLTAGGVSADVSAADAISDNPIKLTILHLNDAHGRTQAEPYISQMAKDLKANGENVLTLDAGDRLHGQTAANLSKGAAMAELMNAVGYDAMTAGNHDFNFGVERLLELSEAMDFPLLAANVKDKNGVNLFEAYTVIEMGGVKIGLFGLATPETVNKSDPRLVAELTFEPPALAAEKTVTALQAENCDLIIALCHLGVDNATLPENRSEALAKIEGIDVIIDGHSHTKLDNGLMVGDTLIAQTGEYGAHIGVVEITIAGDGKVSKTARLVDTKDNLPADERIIAKIAEIETANEAFTSVVVGYTPVLLRGERAEVRGGETNLANVITDSMKYAAGAEIAVFNGGGIRGNIPAGDITMGDVLTVLPFSNIIVKVELSGEDILKALEHGVSFYPELSGQQIQVSGIAFAFNPEAEPGQRVIKATLADGSELDMNKTYTVATIDFIAAGGDGYETIANGVNPVYYGSDSEALANWFATEPAISAEAEGRVKPITLSDAESGGVTDDKQNPQTGVNSGTVVYAAVAFCASVLLSAAVEKTRRVKR